MRNKLLIAIAVLLSYATQAQISGTKFIPDDYPTLTAAVNALNDSTVGAGGVTFMIANGFTEEITAPIILTATGTADNPIIFQQGSPARSFGNPLIKRTDIGTVATSALEAQGDAVIIIQGGDFITFDGIDVEATNDGLEYGYFLRKVSATDACKNVTIRNASVTMTRGNNAYVVGIYASNLDAASPANSGTGITVTSTGGRTENLVITGNTISNVVGGIAIRGFNHAATPYDYMDQNNVVGSQGQGNLIQNMGAPGTTTIFGVHLYYQTSPNISYNTIDNAGGGGTDAAAAIMGVWHQLSNSVGDFVANNNTFIFSQNSSTGGGTCIQATPAGQTGNSITIQNNTFSFGNYFNNGSTYLINCSGAKSNNITVTGNSIVGSVTKTGTSGSFQCYINTGGGASNGGTQLVSNNNFSNVTAEGTAFVYGIDCRGNTNGAQTVIIENNVVSNITAGGTVRGINQSAGAAGSFVRNNTLSNLINTGGSTGANNNVIGITLGSNGNPLGLSCYNNTISGLRGADGVFGLWNQNGTDTKIFENKIFNIKNNTVNIGPVEGLLVNGGIKTTIYNNMIYDLTAPSATGDFVIMGVYIAAGTYVNLYNNTIYLNATTTSTTFGTAGVYAKTNNINLDMRNNIIVNTSQRAGNTGFTVAFRRLDNYLPSYLDVSNNNAFYVSSNSSIGNYIYCDGSSTTPVTVRDSTMADYQARVFPRDSASFFENPPFIEAVTNPLDLHLKNTVTTLCESGGLTIPTFSILADIDLQPRYPNAGYPNNINPAYSATFPDVGADEFGGIRQFLPLGIPIAVVTNASCQTDSDGAIDLTENGGTPPYTYLWSNGVTTQDISGLAPGSYNVFVTDFLGDHTSASFTVGFGNICNNTSVSGILGAPGCFNAYQTITVSGLTVTAPDGHVELIAGQRILMQPGTVVQNGAWLYAHISSTWCPGSDAPISATAQEETAVAGIFMHGFTIFPNPTSGNFTLEVKGDQTYTPIRVEIFNLNGIRVMTETMIGEKNHEFHMSSLPGGVYILRMVAGGEVKTVRLVKTQ